MKCGTFPNCMFQLALIPYNLVPLHPIIISILFHHYKELVECQKQIKLMDSNNSIGIITDLKEELQNDMETEEDCKVEQEQQQLQQVTLFDF